MNWNIWIRQLHRWLAVAFTMIVLAIFGALGVGAELAEWVYFLPLPPLFLLMFSGMFMFVSPYVAKWRGRRSIGGEA
jgi:hypothetical protein